MNNSDSSEQTLSVSQFNRRVKRLLESHFGFVRVEGEISNFARPGSGHWYFSLKDETGQVRCAMFRNSNQRVQIRPENGQQVRIRARVSLYEGRGEFQLIVEYMEAAGAGALQMAFERLKQTLLAEGLFDPDKKRNLPPFPGHVAIITAPAGAAIRDIVSVFRRRFPAIELSVLPVPVQGEESAPAIVQAIERANTLTHFDALILTRGGGSIEDLWSFNDESVARAISASALPVVSAVGHEIDFTISDFVADVRAPTPSAAAELLSPDREDLLYQFNALRAAMVRAQRNLLNRDAGQVRSLRRLLRHPGERVEQQFQRLDQLELRLGRVVRNRLNHRAQTVALLQSKANRLAPTAGLGNMQSSLAALNRRAGRAITHAIARLQQQTGKNAALLTSLGPQATLDRGYAIVTDSRGAVLTSSGSVRRGDEIHARLATGALSSIVTHSD